MFFDEVTAELYAGNGGDGCMAFRREKYVAMGGPFGGNGGKGANIVFRADEGLNTLVDLRYNRIIKAKKGSNGEGKARHGRGAEDLYVKVPTGTVISDLDSGFIIADLANHGDEFIVAKGGKGGRGNMAFATRSNPAPSYCENGEEGEHVFIKAELKLLADVGLVGLPSVGKSTIISKVSASKPKIAAYHFTTLSPNLGVVSVSESKSFVLADLPGLIEGASLGEGLGDRFLRHIERTRVIAHVIDMSGSEERDPLNDYELINNELRSFNEDIMKKPMVVIANKMDIEGAKENLEKFRAKYDVKVFEVSAITNVGLNEVMFELYSMLETIEKKPLYAEEKFQSHILYKFKKEKAFTITRENNTWIVSGDNVEKMLKMTKFSTDEAVKRFSNKLRKLGIDDELEKLGAKEGDTVRIMDLELEYKPI